MPNDQEVDEWAWPTPTDSRDLLPGLEDQPGHLIWRAAARVTVALDQVLPPGVDIHAYAALLTLAGGATRSQQSLADTIAVSRTTMVKVAAELADQGLVERVRNPDDRRSYALTRTPEGAAAARRWRRHAEDLEEALTPGFTARRARGAAPAAARRSSPASSPRTPQSRCWRAWASCITRVHFRMHRAFCGRRSRRSASCRAHFGLLTALASDSARCPQAEIGRRLGISGASVVAAGRPPGGARAGRATPSGVRTGAPRSCTSCPGADEAGAGRGRGDEAIGPSGLGDLGVRQIKRLVLLLQRFVTGE